MYNFADVGVDYCQFSEWRYKEPTRVWVVPRLLSFPTNIISEVVKTSYQSAHAKLTMDRVEFLANAEETELFQRSDMLWGENSVPS